MDWLIKNILSDWVNRLIALSMPAALVMLDVTNQQIAHAILIGLVGFALVALSQAAIAAHRHFRSLNKTNFENIEGTIRDWLDSLGYAVRRLTDDDSALFRFEVGVLDRKIVVVRPKERSGYLFFVTALRLSPHHRTSFDKLGNAAKLNFVRDLRIELLKMQVEYAGLSESLERMSFQTELPISRQISDYEISKAVQLVMKASILAAQMVQRNLGEEFTVEAGIPTQKIPTVSTDDISVQPKQVGAG